MVNLFTYLCVYITLFSSRFPTSRLTLSVCLHVIPLPPFLPLSVFFSFFHFFPVMLSASISKSVFQPLFHLSIPLPPSLPPSLSPSHTGLFPSRPSHSLPSPDPSLITCGEMGNVLSSLNWNGLSRRKTLYILQPAVGGTSPDIGLYIYSLPSTKSLCPPQSILKTDWKELIEVYIDVDGWCVFWFVFLHNFTLPFQICTGHFGPVWYVFRFSVDQFSNMFIVQIVMELALILTHKTKS